MFCSKCGVRVASPEASFCSNCGQKLERTSELAPRPEVKSSAPTGQRSSRLWSVSKNFKIFLFVLLCIALIGMYAAMLLPALVGEKLRTQEAMGIVFWTSLFFYVLFRRFGNKGWMGAIAGFGVGFLVLVAADVVARAKQNEPAYILSHNPEYLAIQKYDSDEFHRIKTELEALSSEPNATKQLVLAKLTPMLMAVVQKALTQTTDEAIVQFARSKLTSLEEVANGSVDDCAAVISGKVNPDSLSRIVAYSTQQSRKANSEAMVRLIEGAAGKPRQPSSDEARYGRLIAQVEAKLKTRGLSTEHVFSDASDITPKERCAAGLQIFREALNLSDPDRAFMLRMLMM